jgi:hypothetical protein
MSASAPVAAVGESEGTGMRATAFGLDVHADRQLAFLQGTRATPSQRCLRVSVGALGSPWSQDARTICTQTRDDGAERFRIEADPQAGYLIWGATGGSYLLSADGRGLRCGPGARQPEVWQRFLIGQVLPFAALVAGLEIFHASCVVLDGAAVACVGPSGAGKTSVALSMCAAGAGFLADDVLALEVRGQDLLAHPGTPLAGVDRGEAERMRRAGRPLRGPVLTSNRREVVVRMPIVDAQAPLRALFFLDRRPDGPADPRFVAVTDPKMLLAATFNYALATPGRLRGLLEACALTAQGRVERVLAGPSVDSTALGGAILRRLQSGL